MTKRKFSDVSDVGPGILSGPTTNKKFRINRKLCGFTYSCPVGMSENPISDFSDVSDVFESFGECQWLVARELHENGKVHFHGWVKYIKTIDVKNERAFDVCGVHPNILSPRNGGKAWKNYCLKCGDYKANFPVPKPLKIPEIHGWQELVINFIKDEPDDRKIFWIWEPTGGRGKSSLVKYLCIKHNALVLSGKAADMKHGIVNYIDKHDDITPELILFDIPRSSVDDDGTFYFSFQGVEEIKNGCFFSGKYEGGMVTMNAPHIIVFANQAPQRSKMSADRWEIYKIEGQSLVKEN